MSTGQIISLLIAVTLILSITSLGVGWLAGQDGEEDRTTAALTSSTHSFDHGAAIAVNIFPEDHYRTRPGLRARSVREGIACGARVAQFPSSGSGAITDGLVLFC